jgi:hypothetical protein
MAVSDKEEETTNLCARTALCVRAVASLHLRGVCWLLRSAGLVPYTHSIPPYSALSQ